MRSLGLLAVVLAACGTDADTTVVHAYSFGPFTLQPSEEIADQCVQITLNNDHDVYVNAVEFESQPGFHHSNWDFVPAGDPKTGALPLWPGPDGVFTCSDRGYDVAIGAEKGGTLFAQSTQATHDLQQFPDGVALKIPAHSKLVAGIHLLNTTDSVENITPTITLTEIPQHSVTKLLAAMSFENHALGLPPNKQSRFTLDCDLQPQWNLLYNQGLVASATPDFHIYYALAHYHALGTGLAIDALASDDQTSASVFATTSQIGDSLGEQLDPTFDMTGYSRLRFSCDYFNNTSQTVGWGIGNQEMCVFLAFTDSTYLWGGGEVDDEPPPTAPTLDGNVMSYSAPCQVFALDATR